MEPAWIGTSSWGKSGTYQGAGVHAARVDTAQREDAAGGVHGEVGGEEVLGEGAGGP